MQALLFNFTGAQHLASQLSKKLDMPVADYIIRQFPDGETYVKINDDISGKTILLLCSLHQPDNKMMPLYLLAKTMKDLGASEVVLLTPYLPYMRQDKRFLDGEGITSKYFAQFISAVFDGLITVDPHLHRYDDLSEIYSIKSVVVHAARTIAYWINDHVEQPLLIGPDSESMQWVQEVAGYIDAPFIVLEKTRHGDEDVDVSVPDVEEYQQYTPVLVDDIISTAHTMAETIGHLQKAGMNKPVCIGVHAVFSAEAYTRLQSAGAKHVVTCNTIMHETNAIDLSDDLVNAYQRLLAAN